MADIGEKLRSAREAKGLSIADIEKATKIQGRYLTAIEQNDFDKLPGDFYTRAFIRQYAQVVGLDGKELLSEFHQDVPESKPDEYVENSIDNKSEEVRETTNNKKDLWKTYLPKIGIGLGVVVVILVVYFLYAKLSSGNQNSANTSNNVSVSSQSSSVAPKVKKSSVKIKDLGNNQYQVTGLKSNRKLVVKAGDNATNVTISVNGNSQSQQYLQAGEKHSLAIPADAQNVVVTFTNDTGTSIKIGGKKVPYTPTGAYRSITLLIGKRHSSNNNNNQSSTTTAQGNTQRSSQRENRQPQSSTTQSSQTQTQSQTQSSQAQSGSTNNTANTNRDNR